MGKNSNQFRDNPSDERTYTQIIIINLYDFAMIQYPRAYIAYIIISCNYYYYYFKQLPTITFDNTAGPDAIYDLEIENQSQV